MPRWLPSVTLLAGGVVAALFAVFQLSNLALFSILVGVASTAIASGLVDLSAVLERHRQTAPLRQLTARRIGRVHQLVLQMVQVLFEDVTVETASDWPRALRSAPEQPIDLTSPANVFPSRTRARFLNDLLTELTATLDELRVLGAAGVLADDVNFLDRVINGTFLAAIRAGVLIPKFSTRRVVADEAAALLEQVQKRLPAAARAAGPTWLYGKV